ncbi:MAG: flippase [Myxococcales bacterium]|nr:flippase [Myxococcales bacterium]
MGGSRWALTGRIRRNIAWKTLGTLVEKGLRLGLIVVAARLLGPEAWGQYTYALTVALLFVQLTDLGLSLFMSREIARNGEVDADFVGEVLGLKLVLAGGYALLLVGIAAAHHAEPAVALTLALCAVVALAQTALEAALHIFRGVQDLSLEAKSTTSQAAIQVAMGGAALLTAWLVWRDGAPTQAMLLYVSALAVSGLVAAGNSWRLAAPIVRPRIRFSRAMAQRFRVEVLPLGVAIVASLIYYKVDVPMIREIHGDLETGYYTAGYKLLEVLAIIPSIVLAATFPALSAAVANDPKRAGALHGTALRWLLLVGGAATVVLVVLPELIIGLMYGDRFAPAANVLRALAPSVLLMFINYLETHMLVALGLVRQQMWISLGLIAVNVGLNAWWIPRWGGAGAAIATAVTELCLFAAVMPLVRRDLARRITAEAT